MKIKRSLEESNYRKKLLRLARLYQIKEIKSKILKTRITNKQIESLLKKNNVVLPNEVISNKINTIRLNNIYKLLLVTCFLIGIFGGLPIIYKNDGKIRSNNSAKQNNILEKKTNNFSKEIVKNEIENDFKLEDNLSDKENTVRLEAATLNEIFKAANYDLDIIRKTKKVKPIYISVLPSELKEIENSKEKKDIFIKIVLPLILGENKKIIADRKKLFRILGKIRNSKVEKQWLLKKFKEYGIKNSDVSELKIRMDIIPVSLALAQAAKETGWGTSRFALEGNALFGQWTYSDNGLEPLDASSSDHKVMKFNVLQASVKAYKRNLNTHRVYNRFRLARAELRQKREQINSLKLVKYLDKYAGTGVEYTKVLEKIIKQNQLMDFDQAKLLPTKSIITGNI